MGARGNSGVIFAQWLRTFTGCLSSHETADGPALADAFHAAADAAYTAVLSPVEGTILTVSRSVDREAQDAVSRGQGIIELFESICERAYVVVAATPDLLPVLKQANVVDAGAEGLRIILEGMLRSFRGQRISREAVPVTIETDFSSVHAASTDFFGYCTEVVVEGQNIDLDAVRSHVSQMGTCPLVIGDSSVVKVHVHTERPGQLLDLAVSLGEIVRVKVDNMQRQYQALTKQATSHPHVSHDQSIRTGVVAVANGSGFIETFESLGATIVPGGQTMNPPVESILGAIRRMDTPDVIVLPNNRNILLAAEQAAKLAPDRNAVVVPTRSMPQGIAAVLAVNPLRSAPENGDLAQAAASRCHCIEITCAVRDASLGDMRVHAGSSIALLDDEMVATDDSWEGVARKALALLQHASCELATIYIGEWGTVDEARKLEELIRALLGISVETLAGGHPNYAFTVSLE